MSGRIKFLSAAIAIAIAATITGIVAYDRGRADKGSSVRYEMKLDSKSPIVTGSVRGVTVQAQPQRYRLQVAPNNVVTLGPRPTCQWVTWQAITTGRNARCSGAALPAGPASYSSANSGTTQLVIRHVRNGCHVWSEGTVQTSSLRLNLTRRPRLQARLQRWSLHVSLTRDARLQVLNRDVVAHQLVQLAGPNLALRGHMMTGKTQLITFSQPGVYHFKDKVVKMGPETKATTIGPDNMLHLAVSVR